VASARSTRQEDHPGMPETARWLVDHGAVGQL
jgi:hypothetical protein